MTNALSLAVYEMLQTAVQFSVLLKTLGLVGFVNSYPLDCFCDIIWMNWAPKVYTKFRNKILHILQFSREFSFFIVLLYNGDVWRTAPHERSLHNQHN